MIFIVLGTQDKSFDRLLKKVDEMIEKKVIQDEVIVQAGKTVYHSAKMKIFDYVEQNQFNEYVDKATYIISHGGVGTIMSGINHGKPVLAVARLSKYSEHENDHQVEIVEQFAESGLIIGCTNIDEFEKKFSELKNFKAKPFVSNNLEFCKLIETFIGN